MGREPANKRTELGGGRTYQSGKANHVEKNGNWGGQTRRRAEINGSLTMDEQLNRSRRAGVANGARGIDDALLPMNRMRETESAFGISEPG